MTRDLLTVVTTTMSDSCGRLNRTMLDLRTFTCLPFHQIVCDDGTIDLGQRDRQRDVTLSYADTEWYTNPGPIWGISYNLNYAFSKVKTPWVLLVEDGLRPGLGWLETAVDAIEQIGLKRWRGCEVGMMGTTSFEEWHLAMAGVLPTSLSVMDFLHRRSSECYSAFWGGAQWPNWNDGLWCWKRLLPRFQVACRTPEAAAWPSPAPGYFRDVVLCGFAPPEYLDIGRCPVRAWPGHRSPTCAWFPGAFALINMKLWRDVGRWRDGATFFEGHYGVRLALAGHLSLALEFPPWLHFPGMGFRAASDGRVPRHHEPTHGPDTLFQRDFGCDGANHEHVYGLVQQAFPPERVRALNDELASVELRMVDQWREWL